MYLVVRSEKMSEVFVGWDYERYKRRIFLEIKIKKIENWIVF